MKQKTEWRSVRAQRGLKMLMLGCTFVVSACGGGGGGDSSNGGGSVFDQSYTTSAAIGEIVGYRMNTGRRLFEYEIVQSGYQFSGKVSGSLTSRGNGTWRPSDVDSIVYSSGGSMVIAGIKLPRAYSASLPVSSGAFVISPILGFSNPLDDITQLGTSGAGGGGTNKYYNVISYQCKKGTSTSPPTSSPSADCKTQWGELKIAPIAGRADFELCFGGQLSTCPGALILGQITRPLNGPSGVLELVRSGSVQKNYLIAQKINGKVVGVIDLNEIASSLGAAAPFGSGQIVFVEQQAPPTSNGYAYINTVGGFGTSTEGAGASYMVGATFLWLGMYSYSTLVSGQLDVGHIIFSDAGLYVRQSDSTSIQMEVGLKIP